MQMITGARLRLVSTSAMVALVLAACSTTSDGSVAESETASAEPQPSPPQESTNVVELGDGHLTFEIPQSWEAEFEDLTEQIIAEGSAPEFNEHTAHRVIISNPDETVHVDVFTNVPWPDTIAIDMDEVELLHTDPLDMGYEPADDGDGMWLRAVIGENPETSEARPGLGAYNERFEQGQYLLVVAPYFAKADLGDPTELGGGMTAFRFPFTQETAGAWWDESITIASGTINQHAAEELTGAQGMEAMQAAVETEEYRQLIDVISSFQIHVESN